MYILLLLPLSFIQCQKLKEVDKEHKEKLLEDCRQYDYCFQDSLMFYKGKAFQVLEKIEDYVKVFGKYDRMEEEIFKGGRRELVLFTKDNREFAAEKCNSGKDKGLYIVDERIEYPNKESEYVTKKFKTLDDLVKKYGKYDSIRIENIKSKTEHHYVWDKAGVSAWATNDTIHQVHIKFTISFLDKMLLENDPKFHTLTKKEIIKKNKIVWTPFSGKICFNGGVVNVGLPNPDNWTDAITKMGISGSQYDPPGDGSSTGREVYINYKGERVLIGFSRQIENENEKDMISYMSIGLVSRTIGE